jgi:hypothetical protein
MNSGSEQAAKAYNALRGSTGLEDSMKRLVSLAVAFSALALSEPIVAQPSQPAVPPGGACLRQNMVNGWKVVDDQTLIVNDRVGHKFTVSLAKGCRDLKWPSHLGFSNGTGFGLGCIGHHDFLYVPANGPDISQRCLINDVQPYAAPAQPNDSGYIH